MTIDRKETVQLAGMPVYLDWPTYTDLLAKGNLMIEAHCSSEQLAVAIKAKEVSS